MPDKSLLEPTFRCEHTDPEEGWRFSRSVCSALLATSSRRSFFKTRMSHVKILNSVHRADMSGSKNPGSNRRTFHRRHTISILQSSAMMPVSLNNQLFSRSSSQQIYFDGSGGGNGSNRYKTLGWASTCSRFYKANWVC